jgi:hypothetical protein
VGVVKKLGEGGWERQGRREEAEGRGGKVGGGGQEEEVEAVRQICGGNGSDWMKGARVCIHPFVPRWCNISRWIDNEWSTIVEPNGPKQTSFNFWSIYFFCFSFPLYCIIIK